MLVVWFAAALMPLRRRLSCKGAMSGEKHPGGPTSGCVYDANAWCARRFVQSCC